MRIENVKITDTKLGYQDRPIFTFELCLEGDGWGCWFGNYALDTWNDEINERVGTQQGFQAIINLLETLEVKTWEELKGKYIRVKSEGWGSKIKEIGHLIKDKWFNIEDFFEKQKGEN